MSGSISFSSIPQQLRQPLFYVEFDNSRAGVSTQTQRALLIGQASNAVPAQLRYVSTADDVAAFAGRGSVIARMMAAYRANDPNGEVWILPLADAGGATKATGTIAITGSATESGTIPLYIGGQRVSVPVASGDAATAVATAMRAAINAATTLPVVAAGTAGNVALTAVNGGTVGNRIDLRVAHLGVRGGEVVPAGITVAITAMASGATDPDFTTIAALIGDEEFDFIAHSSVEAAALNAMRDLMSDSVGRWSYARQVYGHTFTATNNTVANLLALGGGRNDPHASIIGTTGCPTFPPEIAAGTMAAAAVAIKADPARPVQTLAVNGILAPAAGTVQTFADREALLSRGIATLSFLRDGSCAIQRLVTTYQTNRFGQADQSYLDAETLFTLMEIARRLRRATTQKFARSKLANDGTRFGAGQPIVTPRSFKAELVAQYAQMEAEGLVEDAAGFAEATIVQRNPNDPNRLDVLYAPNLVNGLRVLAVLAQFRS